jgi:hypothetical protein
MFSRFGYSPRREARNFLRMGQRGHRTGLFPVEGDGVA